jgi:RHH-type proline utilization regulon transcriptional repressor/proline dehydrogenase/delta 1-pyrroline-5-carboxylate dehydrogenase
LAELCRELRQRAGELGADGLRFAERIAAAAASYARTFREEFSQEHDHFKIVGQDNFRRYLPLRTVRVRVHPGDSPFDLFGRICAGHVLGSRVTVSIPKEFTSPALKLLEELTESWAAAIEFVEESDEQLAGALSSHQTERVRYAAPERVPLDLLKAAHESGVAVVSRPVSVEGRLELLWYVQEQSISIDYHRYGNLGVRADEPRASVL